MARRALIRRRIKAEAFDPEAAPHLPLVKKLLREYLPPLQSRLRGPLIDRLAVRIVLIERSPVPLVEEPLPGQLALCALRICQVLDQLDVEERAGARAFAAFSQMVSRAVDAEEKKRLLSEYLVEHAVTASQLEGDLKALERFLGPDALRERHNRAELAMSIQSELAMVWLESVFRLLTDESHSESRERIVRADLGGQIGVRMVEGRRWQVRWAAGRALVALLELDPNCAERALDSIEKTMANRDEHPWVQACAIDAAVLAAPGSARELLTTRLTTPSPGRDAFVRKLSLQIAASRLPGDGFQSLLTAMVAAHDPSEHVRIAIADLTAKVEWSAAHGILRALAGANEPVAKVRAAAALAVRRSPGSVDTSAVSEASALLCELVRDKAPYPAQIAAEELAALASDLGARDHAMLVDLAPSWLEVLTARIIERETTPHIAEVCGAAAEAIDRECDLGRRALTLALSEATTRIRPGRSSTVNISKLSAAAAAAAASDRTLGRVLADLTRRSWGISARRRGKRIAIWRGDRFRRRLWRVVHELRNPLPNKRQAWVHTVGRTYPGEVRAHPGLLEEATATTVPGERVNVDSEGSWGRHLPTVDDVLDLPVWGRDPIRVVSSVGSVSLHPPSSRWRRLRNWLLVSLRYRRLVALRLASLRSRRDPQRRRYLELLEATYGITARFEGFPHRTASGELTPVGVDTADLFVASKLPAAEPPLSKTMMALSPFAPISDWFEAHRSYFSSATKNSQASLVMFAAAVAAVFWTRSWYKRQQIARARRSYPLSIGGWGTRGKSGTERLKAGLLDGLGFEVFVKTTGCEAMFIHSAPLQSPVEIFIYRPYDKATIWEQMAMVRLGARLGAEAFLWECMALNPKYVQLLQRDWMRDDLVTLTNCYPDHEDIQGPAGFNVANVITEFIPENSTLVTSETSYLPLFQDVCRARNTTMYTVGEREAEHIGDDVLDLFPYREHPRNIALVVRVAHELGIDPDLALLTMAENVVPDLGVLKAYPACRVRGRILTFLCGNSANERTGFINNWRRMKLDQLDLEREPHRMVITVVNNRADRIARSEVFARILVRDVDFDRHVLIGTNLKGLRGFIDTALDDYLAELSLIEPEDLAKGDVPVVVATRLARELGKLRIPKPTVDAAMLRLELYARGAGLTISPDGEPAVRELLAERLAAPGSVLIDEVRKALIGDAALTSAVDGALEPAPPPTELDERPETLEPATKAEVLEHFWFEVARLQIRVRLEAELTEVFANPSEDARKKFLQQEGAAFRALFLAQVDVIEDSNATGDQIIERCAKCVPPGSDVTLMGTQNIKGTGLDFVYRWLALDKVVTCLREQASPRLDRRLAALSELEAFEDHGLVDTGLCRTLLDREPPHRLTPEEGEARSRIKTKVDAIWAKRKAALVEQRKAEWLERVAKWGEGWVDWIDSARRGRQAAQIIDDLVDQRISHQRAAVEMRKVVGRLKGGWLVKAIRGR
ncbi:MAG: hypothetical protein AB7O24_29935 [Kofleriaceae bacterium]